MNTSDTFSLQTKGIIYVLLFSLFILSIGATGIIIPETEPEQMALVIAEELEPDLETNFDLMAEILDYGKISQAFIHSLNSVFTEVSSLILKRHSDIFTPPPDCV